MTIKTPALRSKKLTEGAKGKQCSLQIPGVCTFNPETVVFAHLPSGTQGMAYKSDDFWGVDACMGCHDAIDGRNGYRFEPGEKEQYLLQALHITLSRRIRDGIIVIQGATYV